MFRYLILVAIVQLAACTSSTDYVELRSVADSVATRTSFFEKQILVTNITDPMELAVADDGRVLFVERGGAIHQWHPETWETKRVGYIPVYTIIEDGLLAITLDPDFLKNGWLYVFYGPADGGDSRLSRFTLEEDYIDPASEKVLLHVPMQREVCCHAAGSLTFGPDGSLYLAVGDNTDHIDRAGGPIDERPGHEYADAQLTAANTNDLRGKILRIRPEPDGTYSIPEGNLFDGDALHRPEIYTMGHRNPFRIAIDAETGWLYFADVGAGDPPNDRGGWGWDEFNRAKVAGNYGWPYVVGDNEPYRDYDYETEEVGEPFDPFALVNDSPNNTGARELPPAVPAMIWYTFGESEDFEHLGSGGVNPMSGPVYRRAKAHGEHAFPDYYLGKHFIYDWMRNWVNLVSFDEKGDLRSIEPFLPDMEFSRPMDMEIGADGMLYVIEWGRGFWGSNADAQIVRVAFHGHEDWTRHVHDKSTTTPSTFTIESPADGSFFDFETPFEFRVSHDTASDVPVVRTYTGFDSNAFVIDEQQATAGETVVTREYTHVPDLHYSDRFAELEACGIEGEEDVCLRHKLHPEYKEAEHVSSSENVSRRTYGIQPASARFAETALTVMRLENGSSLTYDPMNLKGIASITIRYKPVEKATVMIKDGTRLLASRELNTLSGNALPILPQALALDDIVESGEGHLVERLQRSSYEGWFETTIHLPEALQTQSVSFSIEGAQEGVLVEFDAYQFNAIQ